MDIAKAFTFVFDDENWLTKIGIGALVALASILIIPIPLLLGYSLAVTRNVMDGVERALPEWDNWGELFRDGLNLIVAQLVYTSPTWLLLCIASITTIGFGALAEGDLSSVAETGIVATFGLVACLFLIFGIAYLFISPALYIQYVRTNELSACFRVGEVFGIVRENVGDILLVAAAMIGAGFVISIVTGVLNFIPCLGQIAALLISFAISPYLSAVSGHLYGQIAGKGRGSKMAF